MDNTLVIAKQKYGRIVEALASESKENGVIFSADKKSWLCELAYNDQLGRQKIQGCGINENLAYVTPGNSDGMGRISPAIPSTLPGVAGLDYTNYNTAGGIGSGDIAQNLLPVSMYIAANTYALDILAVKPVSSPSVILTFIDNPYDNNAEDAINAKEEKPFMFYLKNDASNPQYLALVTALKSQMTIMNIREKLGFIEGRMFVKLSGASYGAVTASQINTQNEPSNKLGMMEFLGFRAFGNGEPMFRTFRQDNTPSSAGNYGFVATKNTFPQTITSVSTELTTNAITTWAGSTTTSGFTITGMTIDKIVYGADYVPGANSGFQDSVGGMPRQDAERTYPNVIGARTYTKSITIGEINMKAALGIRQIEDTKASMGVDLQQKMQQVLVNHLSQRISIDITRKIEEMGELNRTLNHIPKDSNGNSIYDFDVDSYLDISGSAPGGENNATICRMLVKKLKQASLHIETTGRVGRATYIKTNSKLAASIEEGSNSQLVIDNFSNMKVSNQLNPYGKMGGLTVYVDPYQKADDNRIFMGRKNSVDEPGLIFLPYLMAQELRLIREADYGTSLFIRSRYAVVDYGFLPHLQFLAIHVTDTKGTL